MNVSSKVIVFTDNSETKSTYEAFASNCNYTIQICEKNSLAFRSITAEKYNLIIIEILNPVMSEINFVDQIHSAAKDIPIIIVSSLFYDTKDIVFGKKIAGFIIKPLTLDKLTGENNRIFQTAEDISIQSDPADNDSVSEADAIRNESQKLSVLLEISRSLSSKTNLDDLLETIIQLASDTLEAERATLFIVDREKDELWSRTGTGIEHKEIHVPISKGIAGEVAQSGITQIIDDPYSDPRFNKDVDIKTGFKTRSILCIPMKNMQGEVIGVFQILNKISGQFTKDDESFLQAMAASTGIAIENALLNEKIKKQLEEVQQSYDELYIAQSQMLKEIRFTTVSEVIEQVKNEVMNQDMMLKIEEIRRLYPSDAKLRKLTIDLMCAQDELLGKFDSYLDLVKKELSFK